jgi:hypothetical protein
MTRKQAIVSLFWLAVTLALVLAFWAAAVWQGGVP